MATWTEHRGWTHGVDIRSILRAVTDLQSERAAEDASATVNRAVALDIDVRQSSLVVSTSWRYGAEVNGTVEWYAESEVGHRGMPYRTGPLSDNRHTVRVRTSRRAGSAGPIGTVYMTCTCPAGSGAAIFGRRDGAGCYRMRAVRASLGL